MYCALQVSSYTVQQIWSKVRERPCSFIPRLHTDLLGMRLLVTSSASPYGLNSDWATPLDIVMTICTQAYEGIGVELGNSLISAILLT